MNVSETRLTVVSTLCVSISMVVTDVTVLKVSIVIVVTAVSRVQSTVYQVTNGHFIFVSL